MPRFETSETDFGRLGSIPVHLYRLLDTKTGIEVRVTPFGAALQGVRTPDVDGKLDDVSWDMAT